MSPPLRMQLTAGAEGDLQAIYDIRLSQRGADGADAVLEALYTAMSALADFPLMGPIPPELAQLGMADWRQIAVIADSRRDFAALLERRLLRRS